MLSSCFLFFFFFSSRRRHTRFDCDWSSDVCSSDLASIYITALRAKDEATLSLRRIAGTEPLWLSAVVLEELYAGATARNRQVVERLERDFDRGARILVPNLSDLTQPGKLLAHLAPNYDYEQIG